MIAAEFAVKEQVQATTLHVSFMRWLLLGCDRRALLKARTFDVGLLGKFAGWCAEAGLAWPCERI